MSTTGSAFTAGITNGNSGMLTAFLEAVEPLDPKAVSASIEAKKISQVPIGQHNFRRLAEVFKEAHQKGLTLKQVTAKLVIQAVTSPEAALLLCDLWEVANEAEHRWIYYRPAATDTLRGLQESFDRAPYSGEGVLF